MEKWMLTYRALLKVLTFDAQIKATNYNSARMKIELSKHECAGFYMELMERVRRSVRFDSLEKKKIKADMYSIKCEETFLVGTIARKLLAENVWTMEDVWEVMKK